MEAGADSKCIWTRGGSLVCFRTEFPEPKNNPEGFAAVECDYFTCLRGTKVKSHPVSVAIPKPRSATLEVRVADSGQNRNTGKHKCQGR